MTSLSKPHSPPSGTRHIARHVLILACAATLAISALGACSKSDDQSSGAQGQGGPPGGGPPGGGPPGGGAPQSVLAERAVGGTLIQYTSFTGEILADSYVELTAQEAGTLETLEVQEGDEVTSGQVIGRLDRELQLRRFAEAESALATSRARVRQAQAELESLERDIARKEPLVAGGAIPSTELEALHDRAIVLESSIQLAQAQVAEARQDLASRHTDLGRRQITAPFDGRVVTRHLHAGAVVSASTPIITLVDESSLEFVAQVSERRINELREGATAELYFDAAPEMVMTATLKRIGSLVDRNARTIELRFIVQPGDLELRHGMFGRGRLAIGELPGAVHVAQEAIEQTAEGLQVWRIVDNVAAPVEVEVVLESGRRRAVTNIEAGDLVITSPTTRLQSGSSVRVIDNGPQANSASDGPT